MKEARAALLLTALLVLVLWGLLILAAYLQHRYPSRSPVAPLSSSSTLHQAYHLHTSKRTDCKAEAPKQHQAGSRAPQRPPYVCPAIFLLIHPLPFAPTHPFMHSLLHPHPYSHMHSHK